MDDIIKKYKHTKNMKLGFVIAASFVFALSLNLVIWNSDIGKILKTNIQEFVNIKDNKADLYLEKNENSWNYIINLKNSKTLNSIKNIWLSLVFNWENVDIKDKFTKIEWLKIIELSNNNWYNIITLKANNNLDINENETILSIVLEKNEEKIENLNLINANFTDTNGEIYSLSTSWIDF